MSTTSPVMVSALVAPLAAAMLQKPITNADNNNDFIKCLRSCSGLYDVNPFFRQDPDAVARVDDDITYIVVAQPALRVDGVAAAIADAIQSAHGADEGSAPTRVRQRGGGGGGGAQGR